MYFRRCLNFGQTWPARGSYSGMVGGRLSTVFSTVRWRTGARRKAMSQILRRCTVFLFTRAALCCWLRMLAPMGQARGRSRTTFCEGVFPVLLPRPSAQGIEQITETSVLLLTCIAEADTQVSHVAVSGREARSPNLPSLMPRLLTTPHVATSTRPSWCLTPPKPSQATSTRSSRAGGGSESGRGRPVKVQGPAGGFDSGCLLGR